MQPTLRGRGRRCSRFLCVLSPLVQQKCTTKTPKLQVSRNGAKWRFLIHNTYKVQRKRCHGNSPAASGRSWVSILHDPAVSHGLFTPACDCSRVAGQPHLEALSSHLGVCEDHLESRSSNGVTWSSHMAALPPVLGLRDQRSLCCCSYARHICPSSLPPLPSALLALGKQACCVSLSGTG